MQLGRLCRFIPILAALSLASGASAQQGDTILVDSHPTPPLALKKVVLVGEDREDQSFTVIVRGSHRSATITAVLKKRRLGQLNLPSDKFPNVDLYTAVVESRRPNELIVRLKFGQTRPTCYLNDDGRSEVAIYFSPGVQPKVYPTVYETCD